MDCSNSVNLKKPLFVLMNCGRWVSSCDPPKVRIGIPGNWKLARSIATVKQLCCVSLLIASSSNCKDAMNSVKSAQKSLFAFRKISLFQTTRFKHRNGIAVLND